MAESIEGRRPKRRCVSTKSAMPSAIHYVGYVEEDETPEMIMKKFEELEKVLLKGSGWLHTGPAATQPANMPMHHLHTYPRLLWLFAGGGGRRQQQGGARCQGDG